MKYPIPMPRPTTQPAQSPSFLNRLNSFRNNNRNELLQLGIGLMSGQNAQQQMALGAQGFGSARLAANEKREATAQKNKTLEFLKTVNPELAAAVDAGAITASDAYGTHLKAQTAGAAKPLSTVGKINADFQAGLIDEGTRDALIKKAGSSKYTRITSDGKGGFTLDEGYGDAQDGPPQFKEAQAKANIYASRMEASEPILQEFEKQGTDFWQTLGSRTGMMGNYLLTPEYRQYEQAQRDFVNATLRQESGAVISEQEFDNARKQYFPQPGDDEATIAQKRRNRQVAMQAIREASGIVRPTANTNDFSNMSDEQLKAIINGG